MAKHLVICPYCKEQFDAQPADENKIWVKVNRRYAHISCRNEYLANQTQEERDAEEFFKYTKDLFGEDYDYVQTRRLAESYQKKYEYSFSGMLKSLKWFFEVEGNSIEKSHGSIGILPYIYRDAEKYYYNLYLAQQKNAHINNYKIQVEEITIPPPVFKKPPPKLWWDDEEEE